MIETGRLGSVRIPNGKSKALGLGWSAAPANLRRYILSVTAKLVQSKVVGNLAVRSKARNPNLEIPFLVGEGCCDEPSNEQHCQTYGFWWEALHKCKPTSNTASNS